MTWGYRLGQHFNSQKVRKKCRKDSDFFLSSFTIFFLLHPYITVHEDTPSVYFHSKIEENNYIIILSSTIAHMGRVSPHMPGASEHKATQHIETSQRIIYVVRRTVEIVAVAHKKAPLCPHSSTSCPVIRGYLHR